MAESPKERKLVELYIKLYKDRYKTAPVVNKYRERWAMKDVMDSMGYDRAVELLTYYMGVDRDNGHSLQFFYYNFDSIHAYLKKVEEDRARRKKMAEKTKERVERER